MTAGIMMGLLLVFFLDVHPPLTGFLGQTMGWIQFFPVLLSAISGNFKGMTALLLLVLLCLVFGRIYCAVLCPLGIFQDAMIFLSRHRKKSARKGKTIKGRAGSRSFLWYAILTITTTLLLAGSLFFINLVDPFSVFGRFSSQIFLPVAATINNLLVTFTESLGQYVFSPINLRPVVWPVFWITYGWFVLVIFMSFYHGRLYCNALCPVGAFFSLLSRHSVFKFVIDSQTCTACGKCRRVCRSHCMEPAVGKIDGSRCVSCFDCMDVCPENAISYEISPWVPGRFYADKAVSVSTPGFITSEIPGMSPAYFPGSDTLPLSEPPRDYAVGKNDLSGPVDERNPEEKRKFLFSFVVIFGGMLATAWPLRPLLARMAQVGTTPHDAITPPGSLGLGHFSSTCLACHACVSACVENVLLPGPNAYGMAGALQPHLDFSIGRCAYTCRACTLVCPSGAILPLSLEEKQRTRIGSVHFEKDKCLVYTQKRDCGACAEVCPTHAVHTIVENNIHHPRLKPDACIGCGACQLVCPVNPKAIYVVAVRIHEKAGPPFFQQALPAAPTGVMGSDGDFPF